MVRNYARYEHVVALRKRGLSYTHIARIAQVPKSTVSGWLKGQKWSEDIAVYNSARAARENAQRTRLLARARSHQNKKLYAEVERSAHVEFQHYRHDLRFIAGLTLYMLEGDQHHPHRMRVTGARKEPHRLFLHFVELYLGVSRENVRFWLLLYPAHDTSRCTAAWARSLGLSPACFYKSQVVQGKIRDAALQHGVGNTIINNTVLKRKLMTWAALLRSELDSRGHG